jgi:hypothetical protein
MTKKAKGGGPEVFVADYLLHGRGDLVKRLEAAASALTAVRQDEPRPAGLDNIAAGLIDDAILKSKNKASGAAPARVEWRPLLCWEWGLVVPPVAVSRAHAA